MHKLNKNPISIDDNLENVGKGLHSPQRVFFNKVRENLKGAFLTYDLHSKTNPVSLENLHPIWAEDVADTPIRKSIKNENQDKAYNLYGSNRPFVNSHWEALKAVNGGNVLMCPLCGLEECSEMDHYLPRSLFHEFSSHTSNLIPLCHDCNQNKHDFWLNSNGKRYFFNAFFDSLPTKIIDCKITIKDGFPHVKICMSSGLNKEDYNDSIVLRTFYKLDLLKKTQMKADMFMRSETCRLQTDYSINKTYYRNNREEFWKSRVSSYNDYIKQSNSFNFIEIEMYKAIASSNEIKDWVVNSEKFYK